MGRALGVEEYYDNFDQNGYDSMEFIQEIENKEQLEDIGIVIAEHQDKLLKAISEYKAERKEEAEEGRFSSKKTSIKLMEPVLQQEGSLRTGMPIFCDKSSTP